MASLGSKDEIFRHIGELGTEPHGSLENMQSCREILELSIFVVRAICWTEHTDCTEGVSLLV